MPHIIGVHLSGVQKLERRSGEMLLPSNAGKANACEKLGAIMSNINERFGIGTVRSQKQKGQQILSPPSSQHETIQRKTNDCFQIGNTAQSIPLSFLK